MRALAEFIMRGRVQAAVIAVLGLPIISQAAVALVFLRLGSHNGGLILLAAIAPAVVLFIGQWAAASMAMITIMPFVAVALGALTLRSYQSWSLALAVMLLATVIQVLLIYWVAPAEVGQLTAAMDQASHQIAADYGPEAVAVSSFNDSYTLGVIATMMAVVAGLCLLLARWWQAQLYNPGGFRVEIQELRLQPVFTLTLALALIYCQLSGEALSSWSTVFLMPAIIAGIGLVHWLARSFQVGGHWLWIMYLMLAFVGPAKLVLAGLAAIDSFLNLRGRIPPRSKPE